MKQMWIAICLMSVSLTSQATPDCEDIVELARSSTQVSRDVHAFEQIRRSLPASDRLQSPEYQEQLLDISRKVIDVAVEASNVSAADVSDLDYARLNRMQRHLDLQDGNLREFLLRNLEQTDLQSANLLRYTSLERIRSFYSRCFSANGN